MYEPQKIYWEDRFSTGEENLDFQHKYLFETSNKLGDAIQAESGNEIISVILGRLQFYADWHFGKEEECMEHYRCPAAEVNKKSHAAFMDIFNNLHEEYIKSGGSLELAIKIHETLLGWLTNHIIGVDTRLRPCIHRTKQ